MLYSLILIRTLLGLSSYRVEDSAGNQFNVFTGNLAPYTGTPKLRVVAKLF